jgi:hypothetical protein
MSDMRRFLCFSPTGGVCGLLLAALLVSGAAATASAQTDLDALGARVDSLSAAYLMHANRLAERRAAAAERAAARLQMDTTAVGPFLIVGTEMLPSAMRQSAASAVADAWGSVASMVGPAAVHLDGVVIGVGLDVRLPLSDSAVVIAYPLSRLSGRAEPLAVGRGVVWKALVEVMPSDVRDWLDGGLDAEHSRMWAYRDLATSGHPEARRCLDQHIPSCVLAVTGEGAAEMNAHTRASLLRHALDMGGAGSYARLFVDAPDVSGRLSRAAGMPITELVSSWRAAVQEARPNVHAGIARAGLWTLLWLAALALLAMRSTRWRLG